LLYQSQYHIYLVSKYTAVPLPFRQKLNYFSLFEIFEILFLICAKILIKSSFEPNTFED